MDLMRLAVEGRLSEIAGKSALEDDFRNRVIGFKRISEQAMNGLSPRSRAVLDAYSDGVNACRKRFPGKLPLEHLFLKWGVSYHPAPWTPQNTLAVALYVDWNLAGNFDNEIQRWGLMERMGEQAVQELAPHHASPCPVIIPEGSNESFALKALNGVRPNPLPSLTPPYDQLKRGVSVPEIETYLARDFPKEKLSWFSPSTRPVMASNSWVLSGKKTRSGQAMLCNDPHLELMLPSVWMEMHLVGAGFDVIGVCFPGTPILSIGHNRHIAWGATTTCADNQDLFIMSLVQENGAALYPYGEHIEPFKAMEEIFLVREGRRLREIKRDVLFTRHGPVINPLVEWLETDSPPISLRWASYHPTDMVDGFLKVNGARSWDAFLDGMKSAGGPVQNWVYADIQGNIAYIANGRIPVRAKGDGCQPLDGSDPEATWLGAIPHELLPQIFNPDKGYIATANNRVTKEGVGLPVSHDFDTGYRAERIVEVLETSNQIDRHAMAKLQGDVLSARARRLAPLFVEAFRSNPVDDPASIRSAVEALQGWDFFMDMDTPAPTIFEEAVRCLPDLILADEFEDAFHNRCRWMMSAHLDNIVADGIHEHWLNDTSTPQQEGQGEILLRALQQGCGHLEETLGPDPKTWNWGEMHVMKWKHIFFKDAPLPRRLVDFFCFGPFPRPGSADTINYHGYSRRAVPYEVTSGPSMRMIVEMSSPPVGYITNTTGQSGQRMSRHFSDQMRDWMNVEYHRMLMDKEDILREAKGTLVLQPVS